MATASRNVSPGAALLRASRLFSMPAPLPAPVDHSQATKHKSDTATAPYPTLLSVTTPHTSRLVGDWGFKRPLPLKTTTKTTIPLVRVKKVDSIEHVTDFQSASDHTITLEKFREMHLSISVPQRGDAGAGVVPKSVFEEEGDITDLDAVKAAETQEVRWKFRGPWLAGMTDGEFYKYLDSAVRGKRLEFRRFLRNEYAKEKTADLKRKAAEEQRPDIAPIRATDITEDQLTEYIREKRADPVSLFAFVSRFLDLAPVSVDTDALARLSQMNFGVAYNLRKDSPYAEKGPPITHPSAGLSYLRTHAYLENHPVYGPQQQHTPVKARVLSPQNGPNTGYNAKFGVGGFVTQVPTQGETKFNQRRSTSISTGYANRTGQIPPGIIDFDPEAKGGTKVYVVPDRATLDATGKVVLKWIDPDPKNELVHKELVGEAEVFDDAVKEIKTPLPAFQRPRGTVRPSFRATSSAKDYGLGPTRSREL